MTLFKLLNWTTNKPDFQPYLIRRVFFIKEMSHRPEPNGSWSGQGEGKAPVYSNQLVFCMLEDQLESYVVAAKLDSY